jgi:hypothetical protein
MSDRWAISGRRASGRAIRAPRLAQPFGFWSRVLRGFTPPGFFASGRRVGDRPLSGKETGPAGLALFGSWGLPRYERLGDRAIDDYGGLYCDS